MWSRLGCCPAWHCDERLWHAGLSPDGRRCLLAGFDDNVYAVWDVARNKVLWREDGSDGTPDLYPSLAEWVDEHGYIRVDEWAATGAYRVFGLKCNHARTNHHGLTLRLDLESKSLDILGRYGDVLQFNYEADSGDWAVASFSDDGSVIAVVEPYYVTFFGFSS